MAEIRIKKSQSQRQLSPSWSQNLIRSVRKIKQEDRARVQTANRMWILRSQLTVASKRQKLHKRAQVRTPSPPQAPPLLSFSKFGMPSKLRFFLHKREEGEEEEETTDKEKNHLKLLHQGFSPRNASMATAHGRSSNLTTRPTTQCCQKSNSNTKSSHKTQDSAAGPNMMITTARKFRLSSPHQTTKTNKPTKRSKTTKTTTARGISTRTLGPEGDPKEIRSGPEGNPKGTRREPEGNPKGT